MRVHSYYSTAALLHAVVSNIQEGVHKLAAVSPLGIYLQTAVLFVQGSDEERQVQVLHGDRRFFQMGVVVHDVFLDCQHLHQHQITHIMTEERTSATRQGFLPQ